MPVVFRHDGYRFHFYSDEGDPRELLHVHVRNGRDNAKFWLYPEVSVAFSRGFGPHVLRSLIAVIEARRDEIERMWNDHFS